MGFVRNIVESVADVVSDVVEFVGDTVENIIEDPLQAIVTVGAMAMGIPPVWAGALGGAAGAAEDGGNILEGALLGGATGYVGGLAGQAAAGAGAGQILSGAAGGAASGAAGAALTGGDILQGAAGGALTGGATGAIASWVNPQTGNTSYTYDDGSTITRDAAGNAVSSTPSGEYGTGAPVRDAVSTPVGGGGSDTTPVNYEIGGGPVAPEAPFDMVSTGQSDSSAGTVYNGPNGPEVVLESGKTVMLSDYQNAIESGRTVSVDGNMQTDFRVESSGIPRSVENPGTGTLPEGVKLASIDESNGAVWDEAQGTYTNPTSGAYFSQADNAWVLPADAPLSDLTPGGTSGYTGVPDSYVAPVVVNSDGTTTTQNYNGSVTTTYSNGTTVTSSPDGTYTTRDATGNISTGETGSEGSGAIATGGGGQTYIYDDGSSITIHPDGTSTSTPAPGDIPLTPLETVDIPPSTPIPEVVADTPDTTIPYDPNAWTPTPVTPIFPIVTPKPVVPGVNDSYTPPTIGNLDKPQTNQGLNPGWITPTPFYNTTNDVQSQYYWGAHPFQAGETFNAQQYNTVPAAPQQAWGQQGVMGQLTPQQLADLLAVHQAGAAGQPIQATGPVAPVMQ